MRGGGAWHRWWAAYVATAGSKKGTSNEHITRAGTWGAGCRCVFPQCGVWHAWVLELVRRPAALSGLLCWSPPGACRGCYVRVGCCVERFLTMHTIRIARSSAHLRVPIDPARSPMPRNRLLPAPPARPCALMLHVCRALHTKHALVVKT